MVTTFFVCTVLISVIILISGAAGGVLRSVAGFKQESSVTHYFFQTLCGLTALVILYACFRSGFQTTMLVFLVPAFLLWRSRSESTSNRKPENLLPGLKLGIAILLLSAGVSFLLLNYFETLTLQEDSVNYLKISESLRLTGNENTRHFRNVYSDAYSGIEPYHYYEMWLGALAMDLSFGTISDLNAFRVAGYGILIVLTILGLYVAMSHTGFKAHSGLKALWSIAFLFFVPDLVQIFIDHEKYFSYDVISNPLVRLNFRTYWLFLLPPAILFLQKQNVQAVIALLALPIVSFTNSPAVCATVFMLIVLNRWLRLFSKAENRKLFLGLAAFGVAYLLLLFIFRMKQVESLYSYSSDFIVSYYKLSWKAIIGAVINQFVNIALVFGPYYVVIILVMRRWPIVKAYIFENRGIIATVLLLNFCGILIFQAASFMNNSYQFAFVGYCMSAVVLPVMIFLALAKIESSATRWITVGVFSLLALFGAWRLNELTSFSMFDGYAVYDEKKPEPYDAAYLGKLKEVALSGAGPGAYIGDFAYYNGKYYSKRLPDFYFPGSFYFVSAVSDNAYQFCLSDTSAIQYGYNGSERDKIFLRHAIASSLFHRDFYNENENQSVGEKRRAAIEKYSIAYIILTPGSGADPEWSELIVDSVMDAKSGEKLMVLKK